MSGRYTRDALAGVRAMLPWLAAVVPFGLVIGVAAGQAAIPAAAGWFTAPAIYGGSAQIAAIQLLDAGSTALPVIATVVAINLRLVLYSSALARYWRGTPLWWRLLAAYLLIDPSFVVGIRRYEAQRPGTDLRPAHAYYVAGAVVLWVGWLVTLAAGTVGGTAVPESWHLELLAPLYLIGQILPELRQRLTRRTTLISGAVAAACVAAPLHLGIVIGIAAGLFAGSVATRRPDPVTTVPAVSMLKEKS